MLLSLGSQKFVPETLKGVRMFSEAPCWKIVLLFPHLPSWKQNLLQSFAVVSCSCNCAKGRGLWEFMVVFAMDFYPDVLTAAGKACSRKLLLPSYTCRSYMQKRHGKVLVEVGVKGSTCFTSLFSHLLWETWGFCSYSSLGHYGLHSSLLLVFQSHNPEIGFELRHVRECCSWNHFCISVALLCMHCFAKRVSHTSTLWFLLLPFCDWEIQM